MKGAFQTSREIFENPIWNDVPKFRLFFYIVGNAVFSHEGINKGGITIERGQYLRSYRNLRSDLEYIENRSIKKYSLSLIKRKVEQLVKEERLEVEETELGTLFTVVNYAVYQGFEHYKSNNENAERTEREQSENGDGTQREQTQNNNKNVKNDKNEKDYTSKIKDLLTESPFNEIEAFNDINKRYWDAIRETRKNNKVSHSVIYKNMDKWAKYSPEVIEYALKTHVDSHKGYKEEYTLGIMRRTTPDEAEDKLSRLADSSDRKQSKPPKPKKSKAQLEQERMKAEARERMKNQA